jgi:hypothetical protein
MIARIVDHMIVGTLQVFNYLYYVILELQNVCMPVQLDFCQSSKLISSNFGSFPKLALPTNASPKFWIVSETKRRIDLQVPVDYISLILDL